MGNTALQQVSAFNLFCDFHVCDEKSKETLLSTKAHKNHNEEAYVVKSLDKSKYADALNKHGRWFG